MTLSGPSAVALEQARGPSAVATSLTFKIMYKIDRRGGVQKSFSRKLPNIFSSAARGHVIFKNSMFCISIG